MFKYKLGQLLSWSINTLLVLILSYIKDLGAWPLTLIDWFSFIDLSDGPPVWWYDYWPFLDWSSHVDSKGKPDDVVCYYYARGTWRAWGDEIKAGSDWAKQTAVELVTAFTGYVQHGLVTFQAWIELLESLIGPVLPSWAHDVIDGLLKLYDWLPSGIRLGLTWLDWLDTNVGQPFRDWVLTTLKDTINWAEIAFDWITDRGLRLYNWWVAKRPFLNALVDDPLGTLLELLGVPKKLWIAFWQDPLDWIVSAWGLDKQEVSEFFDDPLYWVLNKLLRRILRDVSEILLIVTKIANEFLIRIW